MSDLPDDPILELRLYSVEPGRTRDMERRVQQDLRTVFPRHGIRPLGGWSVMAGPGTPLFVYLTPFRHMHERSSKWASFYADPAWHEVRARTNAGSELVERYEILFLRAVRDWPAPAPGGLVEMVVQQVAMGQTAAVRKAILEDAVPSWQAAGASVCGVYDILSGRPLPSCVFFLAWPDAQARQRYWEARNDAPQPKSAAGRPLLERAEQYLMREVPVDWAA